jgi:HTH-type transcriptional regulator/antitoxin HigA
MKNENHPGLTLSKLLIAKGISQRDLASKINIAHSLLNSILKGNRKINVNIAISLEAAGLESATYWLSEQMNYSLNQARNDKEIIKKENDIKEWSRVSELIPMSYLKNKTELNISSSEDIDKVYKVFGAKDVSSLNAKLENYDLTYFRKSTKFSENRNNVITWSILADYLANEMDVKPFSKKNENALIEELKNCLTQNKKTISKTKKILGKYGIKFLILDRPSKTPVEGQTFISNKSPAIVLTLKYKRLDNFAFTLFHELGHVFLHLTKAKYKNVDFFTNNNKSKLEEFEADEYAQNKLIDRKEWDKFYYSTFSFNDLVIEKFASKIDIHPAIVRGRICHENPEYYRKRSSINSSNILNLD